MMNVNIEKAHPSAINFKPNGFLKLKIDTATGILQILNTSKSSKTLLHYVYVNLMCVCEETTIATKVD